MIINDLDRLEDYIYYLKKYCDELETNDITINKSLKKMGNIWEDIIYDRTVDSLTKLSKITFDKIDYLERVIRNLEDLAFKLKKYLS